MDERSFEAQRHRGTERTCLLCASVSLWFKLYSSLRKRDDARLVAQVLQVRGPLLGFGHRRDGSAAAPLHQAIANAKDAQGRRHYLHLPPECPLAVDEVGHLELGVEGLLPPVRLAELA